MLSKIPEDVMMNAERLYDEGGYKNVPQIIAEAIMAERARCEAALSTDAEPIKEEPYGYAFQHEDTGLEQVVDVQQVEWGFEKNNPRWQKLGPVYLHRPSEAKAAPSVAVKALEWVYTERAVGTYIARDERGDMYWINQSFGSDSYYFTTIRRVDGETLYDADDLDTAKAAAQADYEARIRAALSAQVQDVAGLESNPVTLRWWCQQLLDIIENYDITHDSCDEEIAMLNDIRASVDPAAPAAKQGEAE